MKYCTNLLFGLLLIPALLFGQSKKAAKSVDKLDKLKQEAVAAVEARKDQAQQINDMLFSFSELGFQEEESFKYLTNLLEKEGFTVKKGIAGIPTAWIATWGSGKPLIAVGSDIDCIPKASQKPGVAYKDPIVEGAPGHGEGHNSGQALNIVAVLAVKQLMEREKIPGTLMLWPGVAEELVGTKAFYVRDGYFKDVDACIFTHVGNNLGVSWGDNGNNGLISAKFNFEGQAAHAAGAPWRGRSALDAVELMNIGWNFRREHLELTQRSHYVISDGGDQPNVVPSKAAVWYYFRERTYPKIKALFEKGNKNGRRGRPDDRYQIHVRDSGVGLARAYQPPNSGCRSMRTSKKLACQPGQRMISSWQERRNWSCRRPKWRGWLPSWIPWACLLPRLPWL